MRTYKIETVKDLDEWLDSGEYQIGERFECKMGELRPVEKQEEFDAIVEQCIKDQLWGLSPNEIREFFANNESQKLAEWLSEMNKNK